MELTLVSCRDKNLFITLKQHKKKEPTKNDQKKKKEGKDTKPTLYAEIN